MRWLPLFLLFGLALSQSTYTVYFGYDVPDAGKVGWSLLTFTPPSLTISAGDSINFKTMGYGHLLFIAPDDNDVAFFDGANLTYVFPTYAGPTNVVTDPTAVYSGGPTWAGDEFTFIFPVTGVFYGQCGYHPAMEFNVTVVNGVSPESATAAATRRDNLIASYVAALPSIATDGNAPFVTNPDGTKTWHIMSGASRLLPVPASFHRFIPSHITITKGDSVFFSIEDHIDVRPLALNSSGIFADTNPLIHGNVLETVAVPGGRMIEHVFYILRTGNSSNYTTGFISGGWMAALDFPVFPGLGKLPSNWTVTFHSTGLFPFEDTVGGWCPYYTGPACTSGMKGSITVNNPPPPPGPSSAGSMQTIFVLWCILLAFLRCC